MAEKNILKQRLINPWHFLWLSVVFSELFTAFLNTIQSFIWYGKLSPTLLIIGSIDAMFVPLIVAPIVIYYMRYTAELKKFNEQLQQEIIQRKRAEASRQESEAQYRALFEGSPDAILLADPETGIILDANPAASRLLSRPSAEIVGLHQSEIHPPEKEKYSRETFTQHIEEAREQHGSRPIENTVLRPDGTEIPVEVLAQIVTINGKKYLQGVFRDITERKEAEERIRYLAYYDSLTGLPNRTFYKELVSRSILLAKRHRWTIAILFIDLDYFKRINDTLGHDIGDQLLRIVGDLVKTCIRKSDFIARSEEEELENVVARLGGDEFIVLLNEIAHSQDASRVARRILKELARPFTLAGHEVYVTASIGIALYPLDGNNAENLLKNADVAMYHAKNQGRNNYQFYTNSMNATSLQRLDLENDLRKALDRNEFLLYYQPTVDVQTGAIIGAEALVRWKHPEKGMISPGEFIPLAEETGLIVPIGEWVLRTACNQNKAWRDAGNKPLRISVNLSSRQFDEEGLIEVVSNALHESGVDPRYLELEITESTIMKNPEKAATTLQKLKDMGMCLSIDDFGTGYSSLGNLRRFPLDTLKIDHSFVMNITTNSDDAAITTAIVAMAHSLKLRVIAEGVEAEEQQTFLRDLGCHEMQGFLFSRPVPVNEFVKLLQK